jgi:O-antigen/teichoic acid export membrane protein
MQIVITLGLPYAMIRFLAAIPHKQEIQEGFYSIFFIILFVCCIASVALFVLSDYIANILFEDNVTIVFIGIFIILLECLNSLLFSFFRTFQQIERYSIFMLFKLIIYFGLISYFVLAGYGILGCIIGYLLSDFATFIILLSNIIITLGIMKPKFSNIRNYLAFGLPTVPENLSFWAVESSDRFIINVFLGSTFVGYYSPGYILGNFVSMLVTPISFMLPAILSKQYDTHDIVSVKTILGYSLKYYLLLAIPSVFGLSYLSKSILIIISTPEIAKNGYFITPFVAMSALFFGIYTILAHIIILVKKTHILAEVWILAAVLNVGLNIVLIPRIGILGAGISTLVAYMLACIPIIYYSLGHLNIYIDIIFIFKCIFSSLVMSFFIIVVEHLNLNIWYIVFSSAIIYFIIIFAIKGLNREDVLILKKLLHHQ